MFEQLETRRLLSGTVNLTSFGAIANDDRDDSGAFQSAIRAALGGGTLVVPTGTFNINSTLNVPSDITISGTTGSTLEFAVGTSAFGMEMDYNVANVTINGLKMRSNDGIIGMHRGPNTNVKITNNDFQWGYNGTYYHRLAVQASGTSNGLIIEHNTFHDSPTSDRNIDLVSTNNTSYSYNNFHMVHDGGHIDGIHHNLKFVGNRGDRIHRMGIEIQDNMANAGSGGSGILVDGNIFWDWWKPEYWSFGLSVPPTWHTNVVIRNNYMSLFAPGSSTPSGGWGEGGRGGFAIEVDYTSGSVSGNTIVGPWVAGIVSAVGSPVGGAGYLNNKAYGSQAWGAFTTEGGNRGNGVWKDLGGNVANLPIDTAPVPDDIVIDTSGDGDWGSGGGGTGGGDDGGGIGNSPPPSGIAPTLNAFVNGTSMITLSWGDTNVDETGYVVERSATGAPGSFTAVWDSRAANATLYQDRDLPAGTKFYYRVVAYRGDTKGRYSNIVAAQTKGARTGSGGTGGTGGGFQSQSFTGGRTSPLLPSMPGLDNNGSIFSDTLL